MTLFEKVLRKLKNGTEIIFTKDNVSKADDFLIFSAYDKIKCTFKQSGSGLWWVWFDGDEPMLLENVPESFLRSILENC